MCPEVFAMSNLNEKSFSKHNNNYSLNLEIQHLEQEINARLGQMARIVKDDREELHKSHSSLRST